jgi:hypothetical protein
MPIEFACPCGKAYKVADAHAGKRSKCTSCGLPVVVPSPTPGEVWAEPPRPTAPPPTAEETAEEAALRALLDDEPPARPAAGGWNTRAPAAGHQWGNQTAEAPEPEPELRPKPAPSYPVRPTPKSPKSPPKPRTTKKRSADDDGPSWLARYWWLVFGVPGVLLVIAAAFYFFSAAGASIGTVLAVVGIVLRIVYRVLRSDD